jgi:hypothetical protein
MTTYRWAISAIGSAAPLRSGVEETLTDTWTTALRSGRHALLTGELDDLAIHVDDQLEALLSPGRDSAGAIDPAEITASVLEMHQGATAHLITDLITQPSTW